MVHPLQYDHELKDAAELQRAAPKAADATAGN
jgi:hypothetical protein